MEGGVGGEGLIP